MTTRIYLDWNATAPLRTEARSAMLAALDSAGNASSIHGEGRSARRLIEGAREQVAALVGARPQDVIFTAGGTEANALALTPALFGSNAGRARLLVSAGEHASVLCGGRFAAAMVDVVPLTQDGHIDLSVLAGLAAGLNGAPFLASIMHANNETGVIQPIAEAARIVHQAGGLLHVDAAQSAGRMACDLATLGADLVTLSAHKFGGPQGAGALVLRAGIAGPDALIRGGGQERGRRAGTENVAALVGFGAAAMAAQRSLPEIGERLVMLRNALESGLKVAGPVTIFCEGAQRLPNTTLAAISGVKAETALIALDLDGVAVSSGSACSSGKVASSHVLAAMGVPAEVAAGAIRISTGHLTTSQDIDSFLRAWTKLIAPLSKVGDLAA